MKAFLNGRLLPVAQARVSIFDHSFLYGDGIYETVRAYDYNIFRWLVHYQRLRQGADRLALSCPWSAEDLEKCIGRLLRANKTPNAVVRLTISRGEGPLGLDPALCPKPTLAIMAHPDRPLAAWQKKGVTIGIPCVRRLSPDSLDPQIKSNNCLNTILARIEARKMNAFEAVLLNAAGHLTEGTVSNIFLVKKKRLFTPSRDCGLLPGVTRGAVIALANWHKFFVQEGQYTVEDMASADEIFLTSTGWEIMPVVGIMRYRSSGSRFQHRKVGDGQPGPVTRQLIRLFSAKRSEERVSTT